MNCAAVIRLQRADGPTSRRRPNPKALGAWLCSKQPTATKPESVGSSRLCSEQPAAIPNPKVLGASRLCSEQPAAIPNPKVLGASRLCSEQPAVQSHRKRLTRKEKQTTKMKLEEPRKGEEPPSTPHCTAHHTLHTHPCTHTQFLFRLVPYRTLYHEGRHATHHTKSRTHHTPHHHVFLRGVGTHPTPTPPPHLPTQPATSQTRNQPQTCTAATENATSSDGN